MIKKSTGLSGLSQLASLGAKVSKDRHGSKKLELIPIERIESRAQPRTVFEHLDELAESLKEIGQQQPIVVNPESGGRFVIEQGERRWRAAKMAGLTHMHCIVTQKASTLNEQIIRQLSENIQRDDMTLSDISKAVAQLISQGMTVRELAKKLGKNESWVSTMNSVSDLPEELEALVADRRIRDHLALRKLQRLYTANPKAVSKQVKRWLKAKPVKGGEDGEELETPVISRPTVESFAKKLAHEAEIAKKAEEMFDHDKTDEPGDLSREKIYQLPKGCTFEDAGSLRIAVTVRGEPGYLVRGVLPPKKKLCVAFLDGNCRAFDAEDVVIIGVEKE